MDETKFFEAAERLFSRVEDAIDRNCDDVETLRQGHVLTLECDSGLQIVLNVHVPTRQVWMADRQGGLHFELAQNQWLSTRTKEDFWSALNKKLTVALAHPVSLS